MSNIYDTFRGVQAKKTSVYDERSAAFITEGILSTDITHIRTNEIIKAAVTFNDKEGPDDSIVYTLKTTPESNQLLKGDYYIYRNGNYFVYEDVKLTDAAFTWNKQRALECNVNFTIGDSTYNAYFLSMLRNEDDPSLKRYSAIISAENPLIIIPSSTVFKIGTAFMVEEKPFKIKEYDNITNRGITYLLLERNYVANITVPTPPIPPVNTLTAMVEYIFDTEDAYFSSTPRVTILQKTSTSIKFVVPYGITSVNIGIKVDNKVIETVYTVVI